MNSLTSFHHFKLKKFFCWTFSVLDSQAFLSRFFSHKKFKEFSLSSPTKDRASKWNEFNKSFIYVESENNCSRKTLTTQIAIAKNDGFSSFIKFSFHFAAQTLTLKTTTWVLFSPVERWEPCVLCNLNSRKMIERSNPKKKSNPSMTSQIHSNGKIYLLSISKIDEKSFYEKIM